VNFLPSDEHSRAKLNHKFRQLPLPLDEAYEDSHTAATAMETACQKLLESSGVTHPPVPLIPLCKALGVKVKHKKTQGNATLRATRDGLEIWINSDPKRWRRERFTVAHEIAHILLMKIEHSYHSDSSYISIPSSHSDRERLCDFGASLILMPRVFLDKSIEQYGLRSDGLRILYDRFCVTYSALLYRMTDMLPNISIVLWKKYARHTNENRELRVVSCFQNYSRNPYSPWIPKGCTVKHIIPDIVTEAYNTKDTIEADHIQIVLKKMRQDCIGFSTCLLNKRLKGDQIPLSDGILAKDDVYPDNHVVLFLSMKDSVKSSWTWKRLRGL
jgi:Zn-dependent peptidase ImmA (M78 family)